MEANYNIVIVPGIHWDRSWKYTFQSHRIKLVKCIDRLLEILNEDHLYTNFTLGGQAVSIEDYLEIRPQMEKELRRFIQNGRVIVGPWYTIPDVFLVSPESLIRNLMMGHIIAESFGGVMKVGYIPDSSGQISQMPQILQGFGIDSVIFHRGMGDEGDKLGFEFVWYSPDEKANVLAVNHIPINYDFSDINSDNIVDKIMNIVDGVKPRIKTFNILLNDNNCLIDPEKKLTDEIININNQLDKTEITYGSFSDYIESLKLEAAKLEKYEGELRGSRYTFLLPGVISSRMYIKQANESAQSLMEKWVEPFCALGWLETGSTHHSEFIWYAWKELLKNHSHNNIRGCCADEVHREDMVRYDWVQQIGEKLIFEALENIIKHINYPSVTGIPIVVFNPLSWQRSDPIIFELEPSSISEDVIVRDANGDIVPSQIDQNDDGTVHLSFEGKIPAFGYATYFLDNASEKVSYSSSNIKIGSRLIENKFYRVKINVNGSLDILDKSTGMEYKECHIFEDSEDGGDGYDYSTIKHSKVITNRAVKADIRTIENGPVKATIEIKLSLNLPKELTKDRENRTAAKLSCNITTNMTMYANYPRIDFVTTFENKINDHRLRVAFPVDIKTDNVNVDGHFDVLSRTVNIPKHEANWVQDPVPTNHQGIFLDVSNGKKGFALINKGLPEYEINKSGNGNKIYLTLLRCVGWLSRNDIVLRNQPLDSENFATPEAQCHGTHSFKYSLIPHKGNWESAQILRKAYEHNTPVRVVYGVSQDMPKTVSLNHTQSFVSVEPSELMVSALKKCELGDGIILRFYNPTGKIVDGVIKTHKVAKSARLTNLNEEPLPDGNLETDADGIINLKVGGHEIKTVELSF